MQAERSHLRDLVLPRLEEGLRQKRQHVEWIDLRVGVPGAEIADESEREVSVLKVCFEGVERSRPFLIALIGDRYGWIPPKARAERAVAEAGFTTAFENRSVTDLEIDFGAFFDSDQAKRCLFFFRKALPYGEMGAAAGKYSDAYAAEFDAAEKALRKAKREALTERIKTKFPAQWFDYEVTWDGKAVSGLDGFGNLVEEKIQKVLEAEYAADPAPAADLSPEDLDRLELADFAEDRAHEFVGREKLLDDLERHITSEAKEGAPWGLCITGEAGSGKSALFGALVQGLTHTEKAPLTKRFETTDVLVLAHAAGASPRAASVDAMLRRWIGELAAFLGESPNLPENPKPEDIDNAFASFLGRVALKRRVVVLLDALDQFEPTSRGRFVTWLPKLWHENARLIATTIPGDASEALAKRPAITLKPIPPLESADARQIVANISKHYGRELEPKVVAALAGDDSERWRNPLWLTLATEEVNLVDADDFARAAQLKGSESEKLRDMMTDMARALPPDVPGLYRNTFAHAAELFGATTVQAFLGLIAVGRVGWRESDFRVLMPKLTGKKWDELEFAQLRRSFRGQLRQRGQGQWDFTHAQMRPAVKAWLKDMNGFSEIALHTALGDLLLSLPTDDPLHISETMVHLMEGKEWKTRTANYYGKASLSDSEEAGATSNLANVALVDENSDTGSQSDWVEAILTAPDLPDGMRGKLANRVIRRLLVAVAERARQDTLGRLARSAQCSLSRLLENDPANIDWLHDLWEALSSIGDSLVARGCLPDALEAYRSAAATSERLSKLEPDNEEWQKCAAVSSNQFGDVYKAQGKLVEALQSYRNGLAIRERLARANEGIANRQASLAGSWIKVGNLLFKQREIAEALNAFRKACDLYKAIAASDFGNMKWQYGLSVAQDRIGNVLFDRGDYEEALRWYRDAIEITERIVASDPSRVSCQRDFAMSQGKIGSVLEAQGNLEEALTVYGSGLSIIERLAKSDPGNAGWMRDLSAAWKVVGRVFYEQNNLPKALEAHRKENAVCQQLVRLDQSNADWQLDLAVSYVNIAKALMVAGNAAEAQTAAEYARAIIADIAERLQGEMDLSEDLQFALGFLRLCRKLGVDQAIRHMQCNVVRDEPCEAADIMSEARAALDIGDSTRALALLKASGESKPDCRELIGVCQMRLGQIREAVNELRRAFFETGEAAISDATPPRLVANYATGLLLTDDIRGARKTLDSVWDQAKPSIARLQAAIDRWEQSLSFWERMKWRLGGAPPRSIHLDPPYGEI